MQNYFALLFFIEMLHKTHTRISFKWDVNQAVRTKN
jgi:hypothetical protein